MSTENKWTELSKSKIVQDLVKNYNTKLSIFILKFENHSDKVFLDKFKLDINKLDIDLVDLAFNLQEAMNEYNPQTEYTTWIREMFITISSLLALLKKNQKHACFESKEIIVEEDLISLNKLIIKKIKEFEILELKIKESRLELIDILQTLIMLAKARTISSFQEINIADISFIKEGDQRNAT